MIGKHRRRGDGRMAVVPARITAEDLRVVAVSLRHHHLTGLGQQAYKWRGLARAMIAPVDRRRRVFAKEAV